MTLDTTATSALGTNSVNSDGEVVPSRRVWTLSRFIQALKSGRPPIAILLISFTTTLAGFDLQRGDKVSHSSGELASKRDLQRVTYHMSNNFEAAEQSAETHARNWEQGRYQITDETGMEDVRQSILSSMIPRMDIYNGEAFYTWPQGERNGVIWEPAPITNEPVYLMIRHTGLNYQTWVMNPDGSNKDVSPNPRSNRNNMNFTIMNPRDINVPQEWAPYTMLNFKIVGMLSYYKVVTASNGQTIIQSVDTSMFSLGEELRISAEQVPYRSALYAFEIRADGEEVVIANSNGTFFRVDIDAAAGKARPMYFSESSTLT
ncbi:hypothetical protein HDU85_005808 [Gaertneriomyces sp. JEL0708]|nr:hypothetical protein HDU85_005808 [Gaertneriomyces sp. JEL0708]